MPPDGGADTRIETVANVENTEFSDVKMESHRTRYSPGGNESGASANVDEPIGDRSIVAVIGMVEFVVALINDHEKLKRGVTNEVEMGRGAPCKARS